MREIAWCWRGAVILWQARHSERHTGCRVPSKRQRQTQEQEHRQRAIAPARHDGQSALRAFMGSTEAARCAGSNEATKARIRTNTAASVSTSGSKGLTSNTNHRNKRETAAAHSIPMAQPTIASLAADVNTSPRMRDRWDPRAMRIAISCARRAAENAIT